LDVAYVSVLILYALATCSWFGYYFYLWQEYFDRFCDRVEHGLKGSPQEKLLEVSEQVRWYGRRVAM
jgi:hypothetical protein